LSFTGLANLLSASDAGGCWCPALAWLPLTAHYGDPAQHVLLGVILGERGAASYAPGGVFPVGTGGLACAQGLFAF
jgi:hypothetical protein